MNLSDARRHNLSTTGESAESESTQLVARARVMMVISAITTILAIAAVITVIGYRVFNQGGSGVVAAVGDDAIALPKGARVVSTSASAGRLAVLIEVDGASELRTFDIRTLKQVGRVRFVSQP
jgi:hypothetical protein